MRIGAATDIGLVRKLNEDSYYLNDDDKFTYGIVADGMGGHEAGELASMMMVDIVNNRAGVWLTPDFDYVEAGECIRRAFVEANSIIYTYAKEHHQVMGMGTTATFSMIYQNKIITAHVGDSRAYAVGDTITQITRDHSYVAELVARGELTEDEARHHSKKNIITRAVGAEESIKVDIDIRDYHGECLVICSDGLTNFVEDDEIMEYIKNSEDLQQAAQKMIERAKENGGRDNITVVLIEKAEEDKA